jgi:hypothetical protein
MINPVYSRIFGQSAGRGRADTPHGLVISARDGAVSETVIGNVSDHIVAIS